MAAATYNTIPPEADERLLRNKAAEPTSHRTTALVATLCLCAVAGTAATTSHYNRVASLNRVECSSDTDCEAYEWFFEATSCVTLISCTDDAECSGEFPPGMVDCDEQGSCAMPFGYCRAKPDVNYGNTCSTLEKPHCDEQQW